MEIALEHEKVAFALFREVEFLFSFIFYSREFLHSKVMFIIKDMLESFKKALDFAIVLELAEDMTDILIASDFVFKSRKELSHEMRRACERLTDYIDLVLI